MHLFVCASDDIIPEPPDSPQKIKVLKKVGRKLIEQLSYKCNYEDRYRTKAENRKKVFEIETGVNFSVIKDDKIEGRKHNDEVYKLWKATKKASDRYDTGKN